MPVAIRMFRSSIWITFFFHTLVVDTTVTLQLQSC
jgi:hypothetical protein